MLDKPTYAGSLVNLEPWPSTALHIHRGQIRDAARPARLVPGHDIVINFAAETHVDRSITEASDFVAANVTGVQVLLQACLEGRAGGVAQASTERATASITASSWTEDAPLESNSLYVAAKAGVI